jgi:hypothetical protein
VLLQTDTTKIFFSRLAFNYLRITWNDTAILHDLSRSFLPRKTATSGNELPIAEHLSAGRFNKRKIRSSILGGNNGLME